MSIGKLGFFLLIMNRIHAIGNVNNTVATRPPIDMHPYLANNPNTNSLYVGNQGFNLLYSERHPLFSSLFVSFSRSSINLSDFSVAAASSVNTYR